MRTAGRPAEGVPTAARPGSAGLPAASLPTASLPDAAPAKDPDPLAGRSGRIVHDERGNAIWDWVKETSRIVIDSTSRLLKRLEVPELKVEDTHDDPLSLEADRDPGGGYDPYGSASPGKSLFGRFTGGPAAGPGRGTPGQGGKPSSAKRDAGGGYDPYGKGPARKPGRK